MIASGGKISGMTYYIAEFYGDRIFNPIIKGNKINGEFFVIDVFGKKISCKIIFSETPLEKIKSLIKDIEKIA